MSPVTEFALPTPAPSQAYMNVSALEAGLITLPMALYIKGAPLTETAVCPSIAFVLQHSGSGTRLVFDLGIPRNTEALPPAVKAVIAKYVPVQVPQDAAESLEKGGLAPADVETVILSHLHFDQYVPPPPSVRAALLTMSFTRATFVIGGEIQDELRAGYPHTPASEVLATSVPLDRTRFLT